MSLFDHIPLAPPDPILSLTAAYLSDRREKKVNLGVGYYKDETLQTPIMQCVKKAEAALLETEKNKEYLPIEGDEKLIESLGALVFGESLWKKERSRIAGFQTVGGTGALRIGGTLCAEEIQRPLPFPSPTWPNHRGIFTGCRLAVGEYPYYAIGSHQLEAEKMHTFFETCAPQSIVLLHASCHNPTGHDLSPEDWERLSRPLVQKKCIPFFDFAYQGLGVGISEDAHAVRLYAEKDMEMFVAFSAAKNFSIYGERVGALFIVTKNAEAALHVTSRVKQLIRTHYSNPPRHGAAIVSHVLCDPILKTEWLEELKEMRERINSTRKTLVEQLMKKNKKHNFQHMLDSRGMFCFTGLSEADVDRMQKEYSIYMPRDGRINVCGLNRYNMDYVVEAISSIFNLRS